MTEQEYEAKLKSFISNEQLMVAANREMEGKLKECDVTIKSLTERLALFKDEERMRQHMVALQKENQRLKLRFSQAASDAARTAKLLLEPWAEDLSKVDIP